MDNYLIEEARSAWQDGGALRKYRRRLKDFTYGRQWDDYVCTPDGRSITEHQRCRNEGHTPVTNNIIHRMVKSIIGHYRHLNSIGTSQGTTESGKEVVTLSRRLREEDARALEELLISGTCIQRIDPTSHHIENVSLEQFLYRRFRTTDGSDCRFLGMLHDMELSSILRRFAAGDARKATDIKRALRKQLEESANGWKAYSSPSAKKQTDFEHSDMPRHFRIIEVWEQEAVEVLRVHDPLNARYLIFPATEMESVATENSRREAQGEPLLHTRYDVVEQWVGHWLTPEGIEIGSESADHHPFAMRFYPMIDGEVHSAVEDVVDQQKLVNRLVSVLDSMIASSAKGVLLYPADQLPDGFSWADMRRIWSNPSGILPYKRTSTTATPKQVSNIGSGGGATDLLRVELELFDEISGATGALKGRSSTAMGEGMLKAELENSLISMLDILNSFSLFIESRDRLLAHNSETAKSTFDHDTYCA